MVQEGSRLCRGGPDLILVAAEMNFAKAFDNQKITGANHFSDCLIQTSAKFMTLL
jgi:hypothetical protein